ncbi:MULTISPECIES: hypothetical protein [unclassified Carboxydocella]|uniref:hypothetical protein n=1 Tax=unclassified Carboxydocella TaxID=2685367 RepID=UPI0009ABFFA6|nr:MULTISPECIES: hypothetical protein [unclassified Carboxydocella]AVX30796.1 hypothetical protein CTH_1199 [Carboxydocella thermautotrophica]
MSGLYWFLILAFIGLAGWALYRLPVYLELKIKRTGTEKKIIWRLALARQGWTVLYSEWPAQELHWHKKQLRFFWSEVLRDYLGTNLNNYLYTFEPWFNSLRRHARVLRLRLELEGGWPFAPHLTGLFSGLVWIGVALVNRMIPRFFAPSSRTAEFAYRPDFLASEWQIGFLCIVNLSCGHIINAAGKTLWRLWKCKKGGKADGRPASH